MRARRVLGLTLLMATVANVPAPIAIAAGPPDRIAFARHLDGGGSAMFTANADGSDEQLVPLHDPAEDFSVPIWSGDHSHLLLPNSLVFDGNGDLLAFRPVITRPDGSDYRLLTMPDAPTDMYCGAWSPDASRLYCGFGGDEPGLYTVRASDGAVIQRLTTDPGDTVTDVSPDGSHIVFIRKRPGPQPGPHPSKNEQFAVFTIRTDGTDERLLVPFGITQGHEIMGASWSPDGRSILSTDTHGHLYTVSPAGGGLHFVKLAVDGFAFKPNWSPDGRRVIFGLFTDTDEDLWTADADGSRVQRVTVTTDFENGPDWR